METVARVEGGRERSPLDMIRDLQESGVEPSREERLLLGTDGSVTFLLEVLTGERVEVETLEQREVYADAARASALGIVEGGEVNHREVVLTGPDPLVYAESLTPLSRLEPAFREELMKEDKPIGRIMAEQGIEARRDIEEMGVVRDGRGAEVLGTDETYFREYHVVRNGEVLIHIREEFPSGLFG